MVASITSVLNLESAETTTGSVTAGAATVKLLTTDFTPFTFLTACSPSTFALSESTSPDKVATPSLMFTTALEVSGLAFKLS